jgi:hypothetical protein
LNEDEDEGVNANARAGYVDPESESSLESDLRSRRYPALLGDDDYDSDY